jgi:LysM repeat protein
MNIGSSTKTLAFRVVAMVMVVAVGLGTLAFALPTAGVTCQYYYYVKAGDNLFRIGLRYQVAWTEIAKANNIADPRRIYVGQKLCIPMAAVTGTPVAATKTPAPATATPAASQTALPSLFKAPLIMIAEVKADQSVTIYGANFPANMKFDVRMGKSGTMGVGGTLVTTTDSGTGVFAATYTIPADLRGQKTISIRLENKASGYYSYNWFYNSSTAP